MGITDRHGVPLPDKLQEDRRKKAMAVLSAALQICDGLGYMILITPKQGGGLSVQPIATNKPLNKGLIQCGFTGLHFTESIIQNEILKISEDPVIEPGKEKGNEQAQDHIG